ncbi:Hypothetical protein R9X50_00086100 [Acrodontium crateriforme]|uniref:Phospholipase/carboxylesterase/thioesterase domain-containing protein n=1 Tax=Acrodontium crateriforme TaxID=150365 RepID=A0AAQ3M1D4_9PEZI|nr:Hypothetical protein R9X50_00086100 [Acrodontium crateriforme]
MEPRRHVLRPTTPHTHTIIFLHGRGSYSLEFASEFFESQTSDEQNVRDLFPGVKWIFPSAPYLSCGDTGSQISQWFDMKVTERPHEDEYQQQKALMKAVEFIGDIVEEESAIIGSKNVILGGISQGCALAIHALLGKMIPLGGFLGMSSWLPLKDEFTALYGFPNPAIATPLMLQHCKNDDVVALHYGEELRNYLTTVGMSVEWRVYDSGGHWFNEPNGIDDLVVFLTRVMK